MARKPKLGLPLQALRNAPDVVERRHLRGGILEINPEDIKTNERLDDRLQVGTEGLKDSILRHGQRVPILVRPIDHDCYSLIYGRRRLEACRELGVQVRAIVADLEDEQALRDQLLENQDRRDLSFIERARIAAALLDGEHLPESERTNKNVAEVLNLTEAGVSQLLGVVRAVGEDLIAVIGAAPGIGRPRWEDLKRSLLSAGAPRDQLIRAATEARAKHTGEEDEKSDGAFLAVLSAARETVQPTSSAQEYDPDFLIPGVGTANIKISWQGRQLKLALKAKEAEFVNWVESNAPQLIAELHERWQRSK